MVRGRKPLIKAKRERIRELRRKGKTYEEIANEIEGVSNYTAHKYGKNVVVELRDREDFESARFKEGKYIPTQDDLWACYRLLTGKTKHKSKSEVLEAIDRAVTDLKKLI